MVATVLCDQFGCMPVATKSGEAILALLRRDIPVDLVLLDLAVPDMDAIVAVQLIRSLGERGTIPVVALASERIEVSGVRAKAAGFAGTLIKPYSPRELYGVLHDALLRALPVAGNA